MHDGETFVATTLVTRFASFVPARPEMCHSLERYGSDIEYGGSHRPRYTKFFGWRQAWRSPSLTDFVKIPLETRRETSGSRRFDPGLHYKGAQKIRADSRLGAECRT